VLSDKQTAIGLLSFPPHYVTVVTLKSSTAVHTQLHNSYKYTLHDRVVGEDYYPLL